MRNDTSRRRILQAAALSVGLPTLALAADEGGPAPRFNGKTWDGEKFDNASLMGKVALIQFWATYCAYSRSDSSPLDRLARQLSGDGLVVLAVDVGESRNKVKQFLDQYPKQAKIVLSGDTNLAAAFDARSFPKYILLNRDGSLAGLQNGAGGERALRRLLGKAGLNVGGADDGSPIELRSTPRRP